MHMRDDNCFGLLMTVVLYFICLQLMTDLDSLLKSEEEVIYAAHGVDSTSQAVDCHFPHGLSRVCGKQVRNILAIICTS